MTRFTSWAFLITGVAFFATGCSPKIMINPEYKNFSPHKKTLNIAVVGPTKIDYSGNMNNEFSSEGRYGKIRTFICEATANSIKGISGFDSVNVRQYDCNSYCSKTLSFGDSITVRLPYDTCNTAADSQAIWLFLEQTLVKSYPSAQIIMINFIPVGVIPHKPLSISGKFIYWDPLRKKPVAWGQAFGSYDTGGGVTLTHWKMAANAFAQQMIKDTPFQALRYDAKTKRDK